MKLALIIVLLGSIQLYAQSSPSDESPHQAKSQDEPLVTVSNAENKITDRVTRERKVKPCKYPWMTDEYTYLGDKGEEKTAYTDGDCWMNSNWYPNSFNVMKDFLSRNGENDMKREVVINHWSVSYERLFDMSGDCAFGLWRVTERNSFPIMYQPPFRYEFIVEKFGSCYEGESFVSVERKNASIKNPMPIDRMQNDSFTFSIYRDIEMENKVKWPKIDYEDEKSRKK